MFSIHGDWKIEVYDSVVVQRFSGCWNEEAIIAYVKEFRTKVTPLIDKDWAILSIFEDWEFGVPEIDKHVEEHCNWFKANGCVKDCHIYTLSAAKEMQLERLIPQTDESYERQVFTHSEEAIKWLGNYGFIVDRKAIIDITK
jgi:hypothetical protein